MEVFKSDQISTVSSFHSTEILKKEQKLDRFESAKCRRRKRIHKPPPWEHPVRITRPELQHMREEFWDTAPHYGGSKAIWDALRAAAETEDLMHAQAIIEGAGIIVENNDLTVCYDEKGEMYELPNYVLREPSNLIEQDVEMGTQNPQPVVDHHSTALQS
ncbi:hypothetical protein SAY86_006130 [Trapa natans]|uniref:DC-UbP/UBTD2 N-terminal domain-containing protein n=1 Tax=Trapa natans TaxID=22666 RepID=A0AAN7L352_TRANT|nr:hypothetical protein SAY86_006130 [Trapa natans]